MLSNLRSAAHIGMFGERRCKIKVIDMARRGKLTRRSVQLSRFDPTQQLRINFFVTQTRPLMPGVAYLSIAVHQGFELTD